MEILTETGVIQRFLHQSTDRWHPAVLTPRSRSRVRLPLIRNAVGCE